MTYEQYMKDYSELSPMMKQMVRKTGSLELQSQGAPEIGSSDISCTVFSLYKSLGTWEEVIKHGLTLV